MPAHRVDPSPDATIVVPGPYAHRFEHHALAALADAGEQVAEGAAWARDHRGDPSRLEREDLPRLHAVAAIVDQLRGSVSEISGPPAELAAIVGQLTHEVADNAQAIVEDPACAIDMAATLGVDPSRVRSHLAAEFTTWLECLDQLQPLAGVAAEAAA